MGEVRVGEGRDAGRKGGRDGWKEGGREYMYLIIIETVTLTSI